MFQMCYVNEISFVAATLLLANELFKHRKELRGLIFSKQRLMDSDDEEVFVDADQNKKRNKKQKHKQKEVKMEVAKEEATDKAGEEIKGKDEYDPSHKDPKYANADKETFWEMHVLRNYYHPTIRIWVENMITGKEIDYTGDPLQDFSMGNFLDKIILKPAKSSERLKSMRFKRKRNTRAEEIKESVKQNFEETEDFETVKTRITKTGQFRPDEEYLYKHLLLKSKKEKQERQKELDIAKKEEDEGMDMDALDKEVEDFEMSEGEGDKLSDGFFGDQDGIEDVEVYNAPAVKEIFQEAPSDSESE